MPADCDVLPRKVERRFVPWTGRSNRASPHVKLPDYVKGFIDHTGKRRFYLHKHGFKPVPLPGEPWSPRFMAVRAQALNDEPWLTACLRFKGVPPLTVDLHELPGAAFLTEDETAAVLRCPAAILKTWRAERRDCLKWKLIGGQMMCQVRSIRDFMKGKGDQAMSKGTTGSMPTN